MEALFALFRCAFPVVHGVEASQPLQLTYRRGEGAGKSARMCNSWETAPHVRGVTQKVEQGIVRMIDLLNLREEKVALQLLTYATHRVHAKGRQVMPTRAPRPMTPHTFAIKFPPEPGDLRLYLPLEQSLPSPTSLPFSPSFPAVKLHPIHFHHSNLIVTKYGYLVQFEFTFIFQFFVVHSRNNLFALYLIRRYNSHIDAACRHIQKVSSTQCLIFQRKRKPVTV